MCNFTCVKYLLFVFNFLFWLGGVALMGVSIYIRIDESFENAVNVAGINIYAGSYILIGTGAAMIGIGFFGCCGAMKESACLLGTYFICLLLILGIEVGVGAWLFINYGSVEAVVTAGIQKLDPADAGYQTNIQKNFKCCGTDTICGSFPSSGPVGCDCEGDQCLALSKVTDCDSLDASVNTSQLIYPITCATALTTFIDQNITLIAGIALGVGLAEILGMMIALYLCCRIRNKDNIY